MILFDFVVIVIALLLSATFSGAETAFITVDRLELSLANKENSYFNNTFRFFHKHSSRFLASIVIGNTMTLVVFGIFFDKYVDMFVEQYYVGFHNQIVIFSIKTLLGSTLIVFISEFTPKSLSHLNPTFFLKLFTPILHFTYFLLYPFVEFCMFISKNFMRIFFKQKNIKGETYLGLADLDSYLKRRIDQNEEKNIDNKEIFLANALEFTNARLREILVPSTEFSSIDEEASIQDLISIFIDSGHSKILVYRNKTDNIVGYCHAMHLYDKPKDIKKIITKIPIFPESALAKEVIVELLRLRKSLALVVDEYGAISGIVSTEDIIEEILGEIKDEHDEEELIENKVDARTYVLSARHDIDYLNEKYRWKLPTGDYETLAGLILDIEEDIPQIGHKIIISPFSFEILNCEKTRIKTVKMRILQ